MKDDKYAFILNNLVCLVTMFRLFNCYFYIKLEQTM